MHLRTVRVVAEALRLPAMHFLAPVVLAAVILPSVAAAPAGAAPRTLQFRDDLGRPVPGLEVCFWFGTERTCRRVGSEETVPWPVGATALRAEAPGHGPIRLSADALANDREDVGLVLPRKAELTVAGLPPGARLAFYRATDPVFREPLEEIRTGDPATPVQVPSGGTILAVRSGRNAPDLHRLDAPPGGRVDVRYRPRDGWSAMVRTSDAVRHRPLAGIGLRLIEASPNSPDAHVRLMAAVQTPADGLALFSGIDAPMATVATEDPHHAPATARGLIAPAGGLVVQEVALQPGGTLDVRIRWKGKPAPGFDCTLFIDPERTARDELPEVAADRGRTDGAGRYRVRHLAVGRYVLRIRPPEGPGRALRALEIQDRETTELALDLRPRPIRGSVSRGAAPAQRYRLRVRPVWQEALDDGSAHYRPSPLSLGTTTSGDDGSFELLVLSPGLFAVDLYAPDGAGIVSRGVQVDDTGGTVRFYVETQAITGRVFSTTGAPLPHATVTLRWSTSASHQKTTTDSRGDFEIPVLRPGKGEVEATLAGYEPAQAKVALGVPEAPSRIGLVLRPADQLLGRVVSGRGEPLAGVWLTACTDEPGDSPRCQGETVTAADGTFTLDSPPPTRQDPSHAPPLRLWVSGPGCPLTDVAIPAADEGADGSSTRGPVVLQCDTPPAVLRVHLDFSVGHALADQSVVLRRDKDRVVPPQVLDGHLEHLGLPRRTDAEGQLLLVLSPGTWDVFRGPSQVAAAVRHGRLDALLGSVALDPETVTDLRLETAP